MSRAPRFVSFGSRILLASIVAGAITASTGAAQTAEKSKNAQEFTRQGLLIPNFAPLAGTRMRDGRRAADNVRSHVGKFLNKREAEVISNTQVRYRMEDAGFDPDTTLPEGTLRAMSRFLRADEYVLGSVSDTPTEVRLRGQLVLVRDRRLRQALPEAVAPKLDSAAALFARSLAAARAQLIAERRCENALREGHAAQAVAAVQRAVAAYPRSTIARTCLLWALRSNRAPAAQILSVAQRLLELDSTNFHAIEGAAVALDSLHRPERAAEQWLRLAATDTNDLDLAYRVALSLLDDGNVKLAEPFIVARATAHPDDLRFIQQQWRAAYENKHWPVAIAAAEVMLERDTLALRDSVFYLRLATAYRADARPYKAVELAARGVTLFPRDQRLYSLYAQYIRAEADTVVPRGLALFPRSADLLVMNAKDLRGRGNLEGSLDATKRALQFDANLDQGSLVVAQLEIELGRPDSAVAALHRGLASGEDSALVAQFALAKGNALYTAASASKSFGDFSTALGVLSFADSVRPSNQARFLSGAAALGMAQSALTNASKLTDKTVACHLSRMGADLIPRARDGIHAGDTLYADAAKQSLDYLDQLDTYAQDYLKGCADLLSAQAGGDTSSARPVLASDSTGTRPQAAGDSTTVRPPAPGDSSGTRPPAARDTGRIRPPAIRFR